MQTKLIETGSIDIADAPDIKGLRFRSFYGPEDYGRMLEVISGSKDFDGIERNDTLEDIQRNYSHLVNSDPYKDMLFVEIEGQLAGYARVEWYIEDNGPWIGFHMGFLLPAWRRKGIGSVMLRYNEMRLRQIASSLKADGKLEPAHPCQLAVMCYDTETGKEALLEREGYHAVRYEFMMLRPSLDNLPEAPLPDGLEVRPVLPEHYRQIWDAGIEAFRDHWGFSPPSDEDYQNWQEDRLFSPSIWKVAWEGDQVAGMVQGFINHLENQEYGRLRGYTEGICVRRPWRQRGLAKALIVESFHELKRWGMTEAALTVDTQNLSGALRLYESVGFRAYKRFSFYRKSIV